MFDFIKNKTTEDELKDSDTKEQNLGHVAPGTKIHFNPNLIAKFENDHKVLLGIFGEINAAFETNNYSLVTEKLQEFKRGFMDHILMENVSLYVYMKNSFLNDEINLELVQGFRTEMDEIGKVVRAFILKYETIGVDKNLANSFANDLADIGQALVARIEREETTLYPLYYDAY